MAALYAPIEAALTHFFNQDQPDARRIFHGRGQFHEGLEHITIDWFSPTVLITTYQEIENTAPLIDLVTATGGEKVENVLLQYRKRTGAPTQALFGELPEVVSVTEGPLKFEVRPGTNQNAGLFLDMRLLRQWLLEHATGKNCLNLFAYTCSLSVAALAGNATRVVNVDMSKSAIKWGERNHALNNQDMHSVRSIPHNVFKSWGRIRQFGRYDLVIIDPPTRQRGSFNVEKNYGAVLKQLSKLLNPGATVIATLNSPYLEADFLTNQVARYAPSLRFESQMPAAPEFEDKFPERALYIARYRHRG